MPQSSPKACSECLKARCDCKKHPNKLSANARGYNHQWRKARLEHLADESLCQVCLNEDGKTTEATIVDHLVRHGGDPELFWDRSNWNSLCAHHHGKKSARGE